MILFTEEMDVPNEAKLRAAIQKLLNICSRIYTKIDIEASEHLDTIISNYDDFKAFILRKYRNTTFAVGDEKNIKKYYKKTLEELNPHIWLISLNNLLMKLTMEYPLYLIGKLDNNIQYFIKKLKLQLK